MAEQHGVRRLQFWQISTEIPCGAAGAEDAVVTLKSSAMSLEVMDTGSGLKDALSDMH